MALAAFAFNTIALCSLSALAAGGGSEIKVTLFGQPCLLKGPLESTVLRSIHSISPEQVYPPALLAELDSPSLLGHAQKQLDLIRKSLESLKASKGLPSQFERYRERLRKRLEGQEAFFASWEEAKKQKKPSLLLDSAKKIFDPTRTSELEKLAKKLEPLKDTDLAANGQAIFEAFVAGIEGDPEEDFHRAIDKLNIHYVCSFEEPSENSDD
jgi:hypothetical protein